MKKGHFRLTCVAQKRCCLSSLIPEEERFVRPKRQVAFVVAVWLLMFNFIHSLCFFRVIVEADDQHTLSDL